MDLHETRRIEPSPQLPFAWRTKTSRPRRPTIERPIRALPTVGLFAGIGGIERGLERAGHPTLLLCELDRAARAVLARRFSGIRLHDDVQSLERIPHDTQLVAGGFPCQDLSQAGRTAGIEGTNSGLVRQVFRILDRTRVPWVLIENVPFMLQLSRGRALEVIVTELERLGYAWAYRVVNTRAFGLPQRRERVYLVASRVDDPRTVLYADDVGAPEEPEPKTIDGHGRACGFYWTEGIRGLGWAVDSIPTLKGGSTVGVPSAPAILFPSGLIATPDIRDAERLQGFPKDWTKPAEKVTKRGMRWKLVGNAVTVPVAEWLGRRLARPGDFEVPNARPLKRGGRAWPRVAWNVGEGRFTADVSAWPVRRRPKHLEEFLTELPHPLSPRATAGFLDRIERSTLRFPPGFRDAIASHLREVEAAVES